MRKAGASRASSHVGVLWVGWGGVVKGIVNELNSLAACVSTAAVFKARRIVEEEIRELRGKARLLCRGLIKEGGDENFF